MGLIDILFLYLAFRAKQVICDYFLQTSYMVAMKDAPLRQGGARALAMHAGIHAAFTFILVFIFAPQLWWLGAVDFFVHGAIDRFKSALLAKKGWTMQDARYWWTYGLDQEAHNLTHLAYIVLIVMSQGAAF